jgi:membrane fusion protein, multidrug efflux system
MTLRGKNGMILAMALVIAVLTWALVYFARDELGARSTRRDDDIKTGSMAAVEEGRAIVRVSVEGQKASGIAVRGLEAGRSEDAVDAYGMVVNLLPLTELRVRYLAAVAEARALRAAVGAAESEYRRMEALFRDDRNVSEQVFRSAEARFRSEQSRLAAAEQSAAGIRDAMRNAWGETISGWAAEADSRVMQSLLHQTSFLVQVVIPFDVAPAAARSRVRVAPAIAGGKSHPARFVSDSPQIDPSFPGQTVFYLVDGAGFRAGMRLTARIGTGGAVVDGVIVPAAAVVWHAGKAWAYVKEDEQTFARHEVSTRRELDDGWFNAEGFEEGDEVVVSGAQLLLSEEMKSQIRNENED